MLGKKSSVKSAKKRFLYSHEYLDQKMGTKKCTNQFFKKQTIFAAKNVGKKSSVKCAKNRFLYTHEYRDQKMGTNKCTKHFSHKHTNCAS